ncbi:Nucleic acid-binding, OB-fold [Sesbania bispinosa]|nr:Nucleic acid-binding, OB-fold [Sesbania bispinosa]
MSSFSAIQVPVKNISPNMHLWYVRVQVIRIWSVPFYNLLSRVHSVELMFIDAQGNKIQASISRDVLRMKHLDMDEDKVGLLTSLMCEREYVKDDKDMVMLYMEITDPTGKIECVLYDEYVEDVRDAAIESVMGISRVMFNPGIPEVFDMRNWLAMSGFILEAKLNLTDMETPNISLRDEFLLYYSRMDLGKLQTKEEAGVYVVWATITSILKNDIWWYTVAKHLPCNTEDTSLFNCDGYYTVIPKFKLKIEVCDGNDITYLIIGDEDMQKLLKTSCKHLLATLKGEDTSAYPRIFNRLIGQNMLFLVEKRTTLCHVKDGIFKVNRTTSTIGHLLGKKGYGEHFNVTDNNSHASGYPVDNFMPTDSEIGQESSSSSVSMHNHYGAHNSDSHSGEPMEKHCVHFTSTSD